MKTLGICMLVIILQGCSTMAEKNEDALRSLYPHRGVTWNKPIPANFLDYTPSNGSNWFLVERKGAQETFIDLRSVNEKRGSPFMYGLFKITKPRKLSIFGRKIVEEYSWRVVNCAAGSSVVFKSTFQSDNDAVFQFKFPEKDLPTVSQKEFQVDIACVRL